MIETLHPPTTERARQFKESGLQLDNYGRPLHPWIQQYDMQFPAHTTLWQWGENAAADAIVFNADKPEVLLIKRPDGTWASAGGFFDKQDSNKSYAAAREAYEETGVLVNPAEALPVFEGIVHDKRASRYSWITTAAFLWRTSIKLDELAASDDAQDLRLVSLADVRNEELSGSHNFLIEQAIERYGTYIEKLHYYKVDTHTQASSGGHMAYDRSIHTLPTVEKVFAKQFSPSSYTDENRAMRSLLYLQKEASIYRQLVNSEYNHLPGDPAYFDGMLAMEGLTKDTGWTWRHPENNKLLDQYVNDAFAALDKLNELPIPEHDNQIKSSFVSFAEEGWDVYDYDSKQKIVDKLLEYAARVHDDDMADSAYKLIDALDSLYADYQNTDYDQPLVFSHHDLRESNFAWNPQAGAKIVDWSWAGPGLKNSDATTLIVDLKKRGIDTAAYMDKFNKDHALMMIGFWLMHSTWPEGNTDVRFQQVHSAVAAYDILKNPI